MTTVHPDQSEREWILSTFIEAVGERGYDATPLDLVLARAEVSEADFGRHFENADDCFTAAWDYINESFMPACAVAIQTEARWRDQVRAVGDTIIGYVSERPNYGRMLFVEGPTPRAPRRLPLDDPNIELFVELIDGGRREMPGSRCADPRYRRRSRRRRPSTDLDLPARGRPRGTPAAASPDDVSRRPPLSWIRGGDGGAGAGRLLRRQDRSAATIMSLDGP